MKALSTTCNDLSGQIVRILLNKKYSIGYRIRGLCKIIVFGKDCSEATVITNESMPTTAYSIDLTT